MKKKKLFCNFAHNLWFVYDCKLEEFKKFLQKQHQNLELNDKEFSDPFVAGKYISLHNTKTRFLARYVWVEKLKDTPALVHELLHMAMDILRFCEIDIDRSGEETLAYLVEDFLWQIQQIKKK